MLDTILAEKRKEVASLVVPEKATNIKKHSFVHALKNPRFPLALIAEIKRASPSKGIINDKIDPVGVAKAYEKAGADAISVLTDSTFFKGSGDDLIAVKEAVNIPVLRKDFIIDQKQIIESANIGADAILLIVRALGVAKTYEFYNVAKEAGLDCLVEVHDSGELDALLATFVPDVIGVNNRNLSTFETSFSATAKLAVKMPEDAIFISESGIHTHDDIERVKEHGATGVLVGEALMKAESPEMGIKRLFSGEQVETNAT